MNETSFKIMKGGGGKKDKNEKKLVFLERGMMSSPCPSCSGLIFPSIGMNQKLSVGGTGECLLCGQEVVFRKWGNYGNQGKKFGRIAKSIRLNNEFT